MDIFDLRDGIVADYADFSRSFTTIRAEDIRSIVDAEYERGLGEWTHQFEAAAKSTKTSPVGSKRNGAAG